ncbi:MAG: hypothetical protein SFT93_03590, partial [Rickettsiaceae bacterium]|nr:hypothetical protein [Rickettsiaceae bacterium]
IGTNIELQKNFTRDYNSKNNRRYDDVTMENHVIRDDDRGSSRRYDDRISRDDRSLYDEVSIRGSNSGSNSGNSNRDDDRRRDDYVNRDDKSSSIRDDDRSSRDSGVKDGGVSRGDYVNRDDRSRSRIKDSSKVKNYLDGPRPRLGLKNYAKRSNKYKDSNSRKIIKNISLLAGFDVKLSNKYISHTGVLRVKVGL